MKKLILYLCVAIIAIFALASIMRSRQRASEGTLAEIAIRNEGNTSYEASKWSGWYRPGSNKCNKAVADWIVDSGKPRPSVPGHFGLIPRDPSAHEWADPKIKIPGWSAPVPSAEAMPGDVIAQQHGPVYGHVGIVIGPRRTVSAYGDVQPQGLVLENDWGFRTTPGGNGESGTDPPPTVRRYIGR